MVLPFMKKRNNNTEFVTLPRINKCEDANIIGPCTSSIKVIYSFNCLLHDVYCTSTSIPLFLNLTQTVSSVLNILKLQVSHVKSIEKHLINVKDTFECK